MTMIMMMLMDHSQCLVHGAGEVLHAEAGQQVQGHVGEKGQQLDPEPEADEVWVFQVLRGQDGGVHLVEELPEVVHHLLKVLGARL